MKAKCLLENCLKFEFGNWKKRNGNWSHWTISKIQIPAKCTTQIDKQTKNFKKSQFFCHLESWNLATLTLRCICRRSKIHNLKRYPVHIPFGLAAYAVNVNLRYNFYLQIPVGLHELPVFWVCQLLIPLFTKYLKFLMKIYWCW